MKQFILILVSIISSVLTIELILSINGKDLYTYHGYSSTKLPINFMINEPELGVSNSKNHPKDTAYVAHLRFKHKIWTNSLGCFDYEFDNKVTDFYISSGGSFAHNFNSLEKKWMSLLEKDLGKRILKCGNQINGTFQSFMFKKRNMKEVGKTKKIIIGYAWNDYRDDALFPRKLFKGGYSIALNKQVQDKTNWINNINFINSKYNYVINKCKNQQGPLTCLLRKEGAFFNIVYSFIYPPKSSQELSFSIDHEDFNKHLEILSNTINDNIFNNIPIYLVELPPRYIMSDPKEDELITYNKYRKLLKSRISTDNVSFCSSFEFLKRSKFKTDELFYKNDDHLTSKGEEVFKNFVKDCISG